MYKIKDSYDQQPAYPPEVTGCTFISACNPQMKMFIFTDYYPISVTNSTSHNTACSTNPAPFISCSTNSIYIQYSQSKRIVDFGVSKNAAIECVCIYPSVILEILPLILLRLLFHLFSINYK